MPQIYPSLTIDDKMQSFYSYLLYMKSNHHYRTNVDSMDLPLHSCYTNNSVAQKMIYRPCEANRQGFVIIVVKKSFSF